MSSEIYNSQFKNEITVFISAGEESGDLHGSALIEELKKHVINSKINFTGLGGSNMEKTGMKLLYHTKDLSTIGFLDVVKKLNFFNKVLRTSLQFIKDKNPKFVILIDYPGFNLKLSEKLREFYKGKIIYYIAPQLWAWHEKRVFKIKKYVDKVLVVFPFEKSFYQKYGINVEYVGHPLVKRIKSFLDNNKKRKTIFGEPKILSILPGSRKDEIHNHLNVLLKTARQLSKEFDINVLISKSKGVDDSVFKKYFGEIKEFKLTDDSSYNLILNSDLVLTKAGTSTVECALLGTPFIIFYKTNPINYYLLKPIVKVDKLGMVNLLSNKNIIKELIQKEFNINNLLIESRRILIDENYRENMLMELEKVWNILGEKDASENAAKIILEGLI